MEYLNYGATYYPYLQTSLNYYYTDDSVTVKAFNYQSFAYKTATDGLIVGYTGAKSDEPKVNVVVDSTIAPDVATFEFGGSNEEILIIKLQADDKAANVIVTEWENFSDKKTFEVKADGTGAETVGEANTPAKLNTLFGTQIQTAITVTYTGSESDAPAVSIIEGELDKVKFDFSSDDKTLIIKLKKAGPTTAKDIFDQWSADFASAYKKNFEIILVNGGTPIIASENPIDIVFQQKLKVIGGQQGIIVTYAGDQADVLKVNIVPNDAADKVDFEFTDGNKTLTIKLKQTPPTTASEIVTEWGIFTPKNDFAITENQNGDGSANITTMDAPSELSLVVVRAYRTAPNGLAVTHKGGSGDTPKVTITNGSDDTVTVTTAANQITITIKSADQITTVQDILDEWEVFADPKHGFELKQDGDGSTAVKALDEPANLINPLPLWYYKTANTGLYNDIKSEISKKRVILPPSSSMAGVYARVDRDRGVWKAPANVSLASVTAPMVKITNEEQEDLNVDSSAGKSVNAIRYFTGKGVLVWGARTLAGNDNEWRYVPVRRLFIYVEESVQQATEFAIFEPNVSVTWLKVKSMIESFLEGLWRQGALAGSTAEQAFFVNVGLGVTMTSQDILEGRMNVEIGLAAVRPAEFIILKFSHKLQEA
ncbi:MAG: phage tail sheath family protein [Okeania sp. SIO3I5]|nr:phage tail sheath family protein [Okeania sp. SIO3I5]